MPTPPSVLIVANPIEAKLLRRAVEGGGLRAIVAEGGERAVELARSEAPAALVVASSLYYADPADVVAAAREMGAVPVVAVGDAKATVAVVPGADALVRRPIDGALLVRTVRELIERGHQEDFVAALHTPAAAAGGEPWAAGLAEATETALAAAREDAAAAGGETSGADWIEAAQRAEAGNDDEAAAGSASGEGSGEEPWWTEEDGATAGAGAAADDEYDTLLAAGTPISDAPVEGDLGWEVAAPAMTGRAAATGGAPDRVVSTPDAVTVRVLSSTPPASTPPPPAGPTPKLDAAVTTTRKMLDVGARGGIAIDDDLLAVDGAAMFDLGALPGLDEELGLARSTGATAAMAGAAAGGDDVEGGGGGAGSNGPRVASTKLARLIASQAASVTSRVARSPRTTPELEPDEAPAASDNAGDLAVEGVPELMCRLHRTGFTGRLAVQYGDGEKAIYFDAGFPVHASSNLPHDRLGEILWRDGRITRDQHGKALQVAQRKGLRMGEALIDTKALRREELFKVLRQQAEEIIYSAFGWEQGTWSLGRETAARDEKVSVAHPYAIALEGIRRKYGMERLLRAVGPATTTIAGTPQLFRMTADAGLTTEERQAVQLLKRGPHTVAQLAAQARLDATEAHALVLGLLVLGAASRGAAGTQSGEEQPALEATVDRERVNAKLAQVGDGDYFSVLGLPRSATPYEIRRAWQRMREEFADERVAPETRVELGEAVAEIVEVVDEAYRALSDDAMREAYRAALQVDAT